MSGCIKAGKALGLKMYGIVAHLETEVILFCSKNDSDMTACT